MGKKNIDWFYEIRVVLSKIEKRQIDVQILNFIFESI